MAYNLTSPVTGGAQTGFTSPTYTVVADQAPDINAKAWYVSALGGTQTNVRIHAISDPFTLTMWRPKVPKTLASPNPVTGRYAMPGSNVYSQVVRKGMNYAVNQAPVVGLGTISFSVPAGCDAYDPANVRALVSMVVGAASQQSAGLGDTATTGSL